MSDWRKTNMENVILSTDPRLLCCWTTTQMYCLAVQTTRRDEWLNATCLIFTTECLISYASARSVRPDALQMLQVIDTDRGVWTFFSYIKHNPLLTYWNINVEWWCSQPAVKHRTIHQEELVTSLMSSLLTCLLTYTDPRPACQQKVQY